MRKKRYAGTAYPRSIYLRFRSKGLEAVQFRALDVLPWSSVLSRRVQHFGHVFDYQCRGINHKEAAREFPAAIQRIADKALSEGFIPLPADQCTVNEYLPGQVRLFY